MVQQPLNAEQTPEDRPINIGEMDFAFLTAGDPEVEPYDQLNRIQQNLDQEEQQELAQLAPYVERFFILSYKAEMENTLLTQIQEIYLENNILL